MKKKKSQSRAMSRAGAVIAALAVLLLGYIAGVNAAWIQNAVKFSQATGAPLLEVLDPLHRDWSAAVLDPRNVDTSTDPEEVCINHQCEAEQN